MKSRQFIEKIKKNITNLLVFSLIPFPISHMGLGDRSRDPFLIPFPISHMGLGERNRGLEIFICLNISVYSTVISVYFYNNLDLYI